MTSMEGLSYAIFICLYEYTLFHKHCPILLEIIVRVNRVYPYCTSTRNV